MNSSRSTLARLVAVAAAGFASGSWGPWLVKEPAFSATVWPAFGIGLAAVLLWGPMMAVGVAIGIVAHQMSLGTSPLVALALAAVLSASLLAGAHLMRTKTGFSPQLARLRDVVVLAMVGGVATGALVALARVAVLGVAGERPWSDAPGMIRAWWFANALGGLVVAPVLLTWLSPAVTRVSVSRVIEGAVALGLAAVMAHFVLDPDAEQTVHYRFLLFPLIVWISLRHGARGATATALVVALLGIRLAGMTSVSEEGASSTIPFLHGFLATMAFVALVPAATIAELSVSRAQLSASRGLLGALFKAQRECVKVLTVDGEVVDINDAGARIVGVASPAAVVGRNIIDLVVSRHHEDTRRLLQEASAGHAGSLEFELESLDGNHRWLHIHTVPIEDLDSMGRRMLVGVSTDVTQRRIDERALRSSLDRFELATRGANDGIWDWDVSTGDVYLSPRLKELLGYAGHELASSTSTLATHVHPDDLEGLLRAGRDHLDRRAPFDLESRLRTRAGSWHWFRIRGQARWAESGRPVRMAGSITDIAESRRDQEALRAAHARVQNILDSLFAFVGILTLDGVMVEVNRAPLEVAGLRREGIIGQACVDTYWLAHSPAVQADVRQVLARAAQGETLRRDLQIRVAGGELITVDTTFGPLRDASGRPVQIIACGVDVSERKRTETALAATEERLRLAVDATELGIWDWDMTTGRIVWSRWHEVLWGMEEGSFRGTYEEFDERIHPEDRAELEEELAVALRDKRPYEHEFRIVLPDGRVRWIAGRGHAIYSADGRACRMLGTVHDVTIRRAAQAEVRRLNADLERRISARTAALAAANDDLRSFAYSVTHDLRSPLRAINGFAQILLRRHQDQLATEARGHLDQILEATVRMGRLIDDLLAYAHLGREALPMLPVDLNNVLASVVRDRAVRISELGARVQVQPDIPVVTGDRSLLSQVFGNLLDNALNYRREAVTPEVGFGWSVRDGRVSIAVQDNGIGIPADQCERIFEVFYRLHAQPDRRGSGVGLAIARRAAELMGGRVGVTSEVGKGSTFHVVLQPATVGASEAAR